MKKITARKILSVMMMFGLSLTLGYAHNAQAAVAHVQSASVIGNGYATSLSRAFTNPNTAGNLIVAAVSFDTSGGTTWSCSDTQGNVYSQAVYLNDTRHNQSLGICYAANINAGANTVTVSYGGSAQSWRAIAIHEYSGAAGVAPLDKTASVTGRSTTVASPAVVPVESGELIFGAIDVNDGTAPTITPGSGFAIRQSVQDITSEDLVQASATSISATYTLSSTADFNVLVATFKSGTPPPPDVIAPSIPTNLSATPISSTQINLAWTASTDNVAVAGYKIFRDGAQVATSATNTYSNTGLSASTLYSYTVSAYDAAGNNSPESSSASSTTAAAPFNFTLSNGGNKSVARGTSVVNPVTATITAGLPASVAFTVSGLPSGATANFSPTSCTATCSTNLTITAGAATPLNTTTITVTGTSGSVVKTSTFSLTVISTPDTTVPIVSVTAPVAGAFVRSTPITVSATASDNIGVTGVQFLLDGANLGTQDTTSPYSITWNTTTATNGAHVISARASDAAGNTTFATNVNVTVDNELPTGTILINNGAMTTNSTASTLTLSSSDGFTGVTQMRFSNTGSSFSTAETFATTKAWTLSSGSGTKTVYVQYKDGAGNWSTVAITDTITFDNTAPTISAVSSSGVTNTSAIINWTTNEPATSQVEYGVTTAYGTLTAIDTNLVTAHSMTITGLAASQNYKYRVRSKDATGNERIGSNNTFTTLSGAPDTTAPVVSVTAPTEGATVSGVSVSVTATASDPVISGQITSGMAGVQFKLDGVNLGTEDTTSPYSVIWNTTTTLNGVHIVTAVARDVATNTTTSQNVSVTVENLPDTTPPTAPTNLVASGVSSNQINLSWTASTDNVVVSEYHVERRDAQGNFVSIGNSATNSFADTGLQPSTSYTYRVQAADPSDNHSAYSNEATGTTLAPSTGLVAAYPFSEGLGTTVGDVSGNNNSGTISGGATWVAGQFGTGLNLDGTNDYVMIGDLDLPGSFTVSFWGTVDNLGGGCHGSAVMKRYDYGFEFCDGRMLAQVGSSAGGFDTNLNYTVAQTGIWNYFTETYDGATARLYVNGVLSGTDAKPHAPNSNPLMFGSWDTNSEFYDGIIDEVRIYSRVLTLAEIQSDMNTPIVQGNPSDPTPPQVSITFPTPSAQVSDIITITADASDNVGVAGVQFFVDSIATGLEDVEAPYGVNWDTRASVNGAHTLNARARDAAGNVTMSSAVVVNVSNSNFFQNEILATGFNLPTNIEFLPDGRMLVGEIGGLIKVLPAPYTTPDATPFADLDINIGGYAGLQQGIFDIALDPNFATNRYMYVFYTNDSPNRDRLSRFTVNAGITGVIAGSETILYEDPQVPDTEHHGGAVNFGNDGKIYFTTGEHFNGANSQNLNNPRGKVHRINPDGTIPTDNPFYDGAGPHTDSIWAYGLRNPFRAYYDTPTGRFYIADVGGNNYSTAYEEINLGVAGANYGWANSEGPCTGSCTSPLYAYHHNGRDASVTGGFVYHGTQFPSAFQGNYFYADYAQNWIRRLTFDVNGNVTGSFNFEPIDGSLDGPYGDVVYLTEGPDGALYYVDLGYSDIGGTFGISKIRRIRYVQNNQAPTAVASANPAEGPKPLTVNFSSVGSSDPENQPLSYSWTFGDNTTSTLANPTHVYANAGQYTARLTVSDGVTPTLAPPILISVGIKPVGTIVTPTNNATFRAGDVIAFSGTATDTEDGTLPASAYTWAIDFLHAGHAHPVSLQSGVASGTFTIPTSGHDFSGDTRYRIMLTVTDSDGLQHTSSILIYPEKVNLTFNSVPSGLSLTLDGIPQAAPFIYDTLVGFTHTVNAPNQSYGGQTYTFDSWSDSMAQQHQLIVPAVNTSYTATYTVTP